MAMYILCPYFKRERKKSISCEDTIRSFYGPGEKSMMLKKYCSADWKKCPFAERMNDIYSQDKPQSVIKEKIMENKIEQQSEEIKKLMRKNGQLERKLKDLESEKQQLQENFDKKVQEVRDRDRTIIRKDELIQWLESFAAAFLVVAYGEHTREVRMSRDKVMKLMTEYKLAYKLDDETGAWIFQIDKKPEGKES